MPTSTTLYFVTITRYQLHTDGATDISLERWQEINEQEEIRLESPKEGFVSSTEMITRYGLFRPFVSLTCEKWGVHSNRTCDVVVKHLH